MFEMEPVLTLTGGRGRGRASVCDPVGDLGATTDMQNKGRGRLDTVTFSLLCCRAKNTRHSFSSA